MPDKILLDTIKKDKKLAMYLMMESNSYSQKEKSMWFKSHRRLKHIIQNITKHYYMIHCSVKLHTGPRAERSC
jgi:hypothetical protein